VTLVGSKDGIERLLKEIETLKTQARR